jgi:hypothetical protein
MTTTMAHEMATQRTGRVGRPFTPAEDDTLRRLAAAGHTRRQIADAMDRPYWTIHTRAEMLGIAFTAYAPGGGHCRRCTILLSAVPPPREAEGNDTPQEAEEDDGLCRWCRND